MSKKYIISIPEPCSEDWNIMKPDAKGRYCGSCSKSVYDFTHKTDAEIHTIITENKDKHICGHFRKSQIDRPLNISIPVHLLPRGLSQPKAFAIALFFVFGTLLFSCTDDKGKEVNKIELVEDYSPRTMGSISMPLAEKIDELKADTTIAMESITVSTVSGGIGYNVVETVDPVIEEPIQVVKEEYEVLHTLGAMVYIVEADTIPSDSVNTKGIQKTTDETAVKDNSFSAFPNPSSGSINISYEVLKKGTVQLDIYNLEGMLVQNIIRSQEQYEGKYIVPTDLSTLPNGAYICRMMINGTEKTTKLILAK